MTSIRIKEAGIDDLDEIVKLEHMNNASRWQEHAFESALKDSSQKIYIAEQGERPTLIACLVGMLVVDELSLMHIVVDKKSRQKGVASQLYSKWLNDAQQQTQIKRVFLEVRKSNVSAQAMYKKLDFNTVAERHNYYQNPKEDALVMVLNL